MGKSRSFLETMMAQSVLDPESVPGQPIVEIAGDSRVLIENHRGVAAYGKDRILVKAKTGLVCICGCNLEILRMTKAQLVICGRIHSVELHRGR